MTGKENLIAVGILVIILCVMIIASIIYNRYRRKNQSKQFKPEKEVNKDFADYANTKKLREFHNYLNQISKYLNNPLNELFKQRGMLLELIYIGRLNDQEKQSARIEVNKIDGMINSILRNQDKSASNHPITKID